jgi:hypothetical protein
VGEITKIEKIGSKYQFFISGKKDLSDIADLNQVNDYVKRLKSAIREAMGNINYNKPAVFALKDQINLCKKYIEKITAE